MNLRNLTRQQANKLYREVVGDDDTPAIRELCKTDLFFLLTVACGRRDIDCDWLYTRCRMVEEQPDGMLDLWAREHYKSTIITFGKTLQDILVNPNETVGIFSHTRPISKAFLRQIQREMEENEWLKELFDDVLWENPKKDAPTWSVDNGIIVKRTENPKEATVEAWGLVDGQPTGKHFSLAIYDDVVTRESVTNPEQIKKVTEAWELSLNLGAHGGRVRYIGTRYHFNDTYKIMMDRGIEARVFPATEDGKAEGKPVFLDRKALADKRRLMGPFTFSAQMLQNPIADSSQGFEEEWIKFYPSNMKPDPQWNYYLLCDPANSKKRGSDYTVMLVVALGTDQNYYLVDGVRCRYNLTERAQKLIELHRKWKPVRTAYEKYGKDSDIEHIEYIQNQMNYRFPIRPVRGVSHKADRIRRLVPDFESGRVWMPPRLLFVDEEGKTRDLIREFIEEEYVYFPASLHDDTLDCLSRIKDVGAVFPKDAKLQIGGGHKGKQGGDFDPFAI